MFSSSDYALLDFGAGRKLEVFGGIRVDRPSPAATGKIALPELWEGSARFDRNQGIWQGTPPPSTWRARFNELIFELHSTDSGQVGIFPEQAANWEYIARRVRTRPQAKLLNLFAYTGGSTLAAAGAGAQVVHVDASKSVVNWARRNAEHSNLGHASIRWIVEDAPRFVQREIKRGNRYDGIILDPPSYGHGPKGEEWKLSRDLLDLLGSCKAILSEHPLMFLLSCHTSGFGEAELSAALSSCIFGSCAAGIQTRSLQIRAADGRSLSAGHAACWP